MDSTHGTCFLTWIHNPANLDYISLRLRPLCLEYPLVDVANVLRWIGADWTSADCKALFRAITQSWDQSKRRMLAFLLIRDEEMRQKAKSKLVEYAQKSRAKSQQQQQQHLWRRSQQHQNQQPQQLGGIQGNQLHQQLHKVQSTAASAAIVDVGSVGAIVDTATPTATTTTASTDSGSWGDLKTLEDIVAASIISGIDMTIPSESIAPHASLRQHRFSPY
ncbi:hypothetical protein BGZ54_003268 [Gamsiella multidivaricata]|nr:hypothetical protein BGZ54_003268 [Gamsiella multidivaricata]